MLPDKGGYGKRPPGQKVTNGLEARMTADVSGELEDGLHLALCGAGRIG